jgi:glutathione S-transferase
VKPLFLYRWWDPQDQVYVSRWAGEEWSVSDAEPGSAEEIEHFRRRQISRMPILGATAENKPLLEESYHRILAAFEPHVGMTRYLFGSRPSLADFAWFGQLSELATDPSPMRIMRGLSYALSPFKYQVKCLDLIRDKFAALDTEHRTALLPVLERTGCWEHLLAK